MHAYLILTMFSQITALFGTTRLFIFDQKSPLHDYLGIHDFGMETNSACTHSSPFELPVSFAITQPRHRKQRGMGMNVS